MPRRPAAPGPRSADAALRTFFALWPDPAARDVLAALANDTAAQAQGRATWAANLHLTLAFLGNVAATRIGGLHAIGGAVAAAVPPFTLLLDRVGAFRDAGIAWAGASATPPELERLVQLLSSALAKEGFPTERRTFQPHLTLARRCQRPAGAGVAVPIAWSVTRIALNASETLRSGARYRALADWPLDGRAPER